MNQPVPVICLALLAFAPASPAASAWLSSSELEQSCDAFLADPDSEAGAQCLAYVQGYLTASDPARTTRYPGENDESFAERAARTRLGSLRMQRIEGTDAAYCVGENVPAVEVVREVVAYLREASGDCDLTDAQAVREALAYKFPCNDSNVGN